MLQNEYLVLVFAPKNRLRYARERALQNLANFNKNSLFQSVAPKKTSGKRRPEGQGRATVSVPDRAGCEAADSGVPHIVHVRPTTTSERDELVA